MLKKERQDLILMKLNTKGKVIVNELALDLSVSEDTIRRDLMEMDKKGILKRVFGGALPLNRYVINYAERENFEPELKYELALKAVNLMKENQVIAIDGSTTNLQLARAIPVNLNLTVLTNSLSIANELCNHKNINVIMIGGNLFKKIMTNVGHLAENQIKEYYPDICFMGAYAIHPLMGITSPYEEEVGVKRQFIKSSGRTVTLVIPEKFNVIMPYKVCDIKDITTIVTDKRVSEEILKEYEKIGIECI
ncbi:MAG: DeoR/GlpR family DNA-binding transcription regulator [Leptotrichiaceae bacterium]|nr:DeoR/GlpR family DNA-binding transcription regulator [Leptotrichiaceae bacterium]